MQISIFERKSSSDLLSNGIQQTNRFTAVHIVRKSRLRSSNSNIIDRVTKTFQLVLIDVSTVHSPRIL